MSARWTIRTTAAWVLTCLLLPAFGPAASAAGDPLQLTVDGHALQEGLDGTLDDGPLLPGAGDTVVVVARNNASRRGKLTLRLTNVISGEGGCLRRERLADDDTCGAGQGEGVGSLHLRLLRITGKKLSTRRVVASETVEDFGSRVLAPSLRPGEAAVYELRLSVPSTVGDVAQTDTIAFATVWTLQGLPDVPATKPRKPAKPRRVVRGHLLDADVVATPGFAAGGRVTPVPVSILWIVGTALLVMLPPWRRLRGAPRAGRRAPPAG